MKVFQPILRGLNWLFLCKRLLLLQLFCIDAGHMTENTPYIKKVFECITLMKENIYRMILLIFSTIRHVFRTTLIDWLFI